MERIQQIERAIRERFGGEILLTPSEARSVLRVGKTRWQELVRDGVVPISRICSGSAPRITTHDLAELVLAGGATRV